MKKITILNLFMCALLFCADTMFILEGELIIKSIASLIFVVIGFVNLIYMTKVKRIRRLSAYLLFLGLCFACLGDIILEREFIVGGILFAVGHIFYFLSYCKVISFRWKDLIFGFTLFVVSICVIFLLPIFKDLEMIIKILCSSYALVISLMVGKAISNAFRRASQLNIILLIASMLFFISDLTLLFNVFGQGDSALTVICLLTYYPREFLLAFSILKMNKN